MPTHLNDLKGTFLYTMCWIRCFF